MYKAVGKKRFIRASLLNNNTALVLLGEIKSLTYIGRAFIITKGGRIRHDKHKFLCSS
jgi:hypothetical protein